MVMNGSNEMDDSPLRKSTFIYFSEIARLFGSKLKIPNVISGNQEKVQDSGIIKTQPNNSQGQKHGQNGNTNSVPFVPNLMMMNSDNSATNQQQQQQQRASGPRPTHHLLYHLVKMVKIILVYIKEYHKIINISTSNTCT